MFPKHLFIVISFAVVAFFLIDLSTPVVKVKNGFVVSVEGKPCHRKLGKWDHLEGKIVYLK